MEKVSRDRQPAVAGMFYPAYPDELSEQIDSFLRNANPPTIHGQILALVSPHAGYVYSGQVAAYGYKTVMGKSYDLVVVISPSHRAYFKGASVYAVGNYITPLGIAEVDREACAALMAQDPTIQFHPQVHEQEHALEVQIPFLQRALKDFKLLPIVMGNQDYSTCERLKDALLKVVKGKNVLIVASSDLSHYHPDETARRIDARTLETALALDAAGLLQQEACGRHPWAALTAVAASRGWRPELLAYATSGDTSGDRSRVVGYAALRYD